MTNRLRRDESQTGESAGPEPQQPCASEPSWFFEGENQPSREELIARYRKHYYLSEDGGAAVPQWHAAENKLGYRDLIATPRTAGRLRFSPSLPYADALGAVHNELAEHAGHGLRRTYAIAALCAMVAGGTVGFLASQAHSITLQALALFDTPAAIATPRPAAPAPRLAVANITAKKPVATASLQVEDASGRVDSLIPLVLHAEPALAEQDLLLKLSGLPDKAFLTSGHRGADKAWSLSLADLKDVKLVVPGPGQPEINLAVAAFERGSGELAAPVKTMTIALTDAVVVPTSSPPPQPVFTAPVSGRADLPSPIPVPMNMGLTLASLGGASQNLVVEGDKKLRGGETAAARQLYERAWSGGSSEGALALARSFDPIVLAQLRLKGVSPSRTQALYWYGRAADAGRKEAREAIVRLKVKP